MNSRKTACLAFVILAATSIATTAQTFTTLAYFTDGTSVDSPLIQGRDGNFYGTSSNGGTGSYGTVFKVTTSGTLTTLHAFCSQSNCADGVYPSPGLALGTDGNLYGTAWDGGANDMGVVFRITPGGVYTVLHSFQGADGSEPEAGLALASDGNFYGTTTSGGSGGTCIYGCGTVFKMTPAAAVTTLHNFDYNDGYVPQAPMIQGSDGSLYGTTEDGGAYSSYDCLYGCGTVFKVTTDGTFTLLHSFDWSDGARIVAPLAQDSNGAFYGTASYGGDVGFHGCSNGCGTVFKVSSGGTFAIVHKYAQNDDPGTSSFVLASDGNLYGESNVVWKLIPPTTFTTVYTFTGAGFAATAVLQGTDGLFYGTYYYEYPYSAIYSLDIGLGPFVAFVVPSGKVGQTAQILGQGLTGTTSVTFNGVTAAKFTVVSDTYMTAVVPKGATTGTVVVTTPTGALTSNRSFKIAN